MHQKSERKKAVAKSGSGKIIPLLLAAHSVLFLLPHTHAAIEVIGTQYRQDQLFPEFDCYWNGGGYPTYCPTNRPGANLTVQVKNTGTSPVTITDATLAGHSLQSVIKMSEASWNPDQQNSIYFNWEDPPANILNAGEPVWWRADPPTVPAGGVAQVAVRLRTVPTTATLGFGVVSSSGTVNTNITVDANAPRITSIGYAEDRKKIYLHWRRPMDGIGAAPVAVYLNGTNVTGYTTTVGDPSLNFAASVISLSNALPFFSYNVFQGVYADGKTAATGQRAWTNKFIYTTWSTFEESGNYDAADWLEEAAAHGFNNVEMNLGAMGSYMGTSAGRAHMQSKGYGYTIMDAAKLNALDPDCWFLNDEPDTEELNQGNTHCGTGLRLPCSSWFYAGTLVMKEAVRFTAELRAARPLVPTTVNLDGGLQPQSWYTWGPAVDVLESNNYYEVRLKDAWYAQSNRLPLHRKPLVSYAVARSGTEGAAPNPFRHILYSCKQVDPDWPYPYPQSKHIEAYYSLAGGTKGIGYWWFNPPRGLYNSAQAAALWKEMGLLGNEIKTARDLIVRSTPVDLPLTPGANVWARAVTSGVDSLILYVVNDNFANDNVSCKVTNVPNATVTITLPLWMQSGVTAFEVTAGGLRAVDTQRNGSNLQINLGTLVLTRMIILTTDPQLPLAIHQRYLQQVRANVCTFASELCGNAAPSIVVPPQSRAALSGENVNFNVVANGMPTPTYQWRFKPAPDGPLTNLAGATTASYTRSNAQASHAGGYSVVISNSLGVITSAVATLTVSTNGLPPSIIAPPQSQTVERGQNATFTVTASGSEPLSYQWRFKSSPDGPPANLAGATQSSYTRFNAQTNDAGYYAVVITNAAGAITSAPATLTVTVPVLCLPVSLVNGGFEGGNTGGVATGWTGYQRAPNPTTVWSIQTASPPEAGSTQYQQIANSSSGGGGGVRQDIAGTVPGATYRISGWMRGNSISYSTCTVKVSPTASTSWATAVDLNPPQSVLGSVWVTFDGTVVATGPSMTLWLDGLTTGTAQYKAECFDSVTITCEGALARPVLEVVQQGANLVFRWPANYGNYNLIAATNLGSGAIWSTVLPSPTVVNGTNVVTNAISGQNKFYRLMGP